MERSHDGNHHLIPRLTTPHALEHKGKLIGAKPPLRIKNVWAIRSTLQLSGRIVSGALKPCVFINVDLIESKVTPFPQLETP